MDAANPEGIGLAWRETVGPKNAKEVVVKWKKGLVLSEAIPLIEKLPTPFVLHFRIQSCGGRTKELTHPFPVEREMRQDLEGTIKGQVLFHNGHWHRYKDCGIDGAIKNRVKVPDGKWSDTRVMAWLTHLHGPGMLELIDEKVILFGPEKIEIFHPDGWSRVNDLLVSNRGWENQYVNRNGFVRVGRDDEVDWENGANDHIRKVCRSARCNNTVVGDTFYCSDHQPACRVGNCSKPRIFGTEYCDQHRVMCLSPLCSSPREIGEKYCLKHLSLKELEAMNAKNQRESGGTSIPVPFRPGSEVVSGGSDNTAGSSGVREEVDGVGERVQDGANVDRPAILDDPIAQEQSTWARSLNPKAVSTPHTRPMSLMQIIKGRSSDTKTTIM